MSNKLPHVLHAGVLGVLGAALAFPFRGSFLQFPRCHGLNGSKSNAASHFFFSGHACCGVHVAEGRVPL